MAYDSKNLDLVAQGIAQRQEWRYLDTGGETAAGYMAAGFFTDVKDKGVDTGDVCVIYNKAGGKVYTGYFVTVQDTGATSGTWKRDTG
jgi:hypothetical protein